MEPSNSLNAWGWLSFVLGWAIIIGFSVFLFARVLRAQKRGALGIEIGSRARWATRVGLILAMAGNAIGLGNFLRFPAKAAANGGGAFLIPYFCALLFLGIPLMWVEWTLGRYGGARGHGSTPGMFGLMWKNPISKYLGSLGIALPFTVAVFYCFIESWTLAFAVFSATGAYNGNTTREAMGQFLHAYQGVVQNQHFSSILPAAVFLLISLACNYYFLRKGLARGIEILARYGMPILFVFAIILAIRVLTLGTPDGTHPDWNTQAGLAYMWNPDFSKLSSASVWLIAAGQIFFTLSLGQGMINTYASYVREDEDITLNGLTTTMTNEFAEVVLGGTIAIPAAVAFFGLAEAQIVAKEGAFNLGFQTLPIVFQKIPLGQVFGTMWFVLLFIAGITSSVAMLQPIVAFLEDEFGWKRERAVNAVFAVLAGCAIPVVLFFKHGFLDELDFWAGTFGLALFAVIEIIIFSWVFGVDKGWTEMHRGADLKVPRVFRFVLLVITPLYLLAIFAVWTWQDAIGKLLMEGEEAANRPYLWAARLLFVGIIAGTLLLIRAAWRRKARLQSSPESSP